ncbi:sensor histidine kinase [Plantactinospora soyae]|uniref:histidine kinase n=1 Tax=Plantactinospora soyae TaxID=1544732 RepID=A0A927QX82_9ACTN|nr:sensor histidine kinase [Plantactinospora soyae]MBE1487770.1 signal transduction histidine kinase [Plantactinospora soyae]
MAEHPAGSVRTLARSPAAQDAALAAAVLLLCVLLGTPVDGLAKSSDSAPPDDSSAMWWAATVVAAVGIAMRRRWPLPMLVLCTGTVVVHLALLVPVTVIDLSAPILLATVAVRYPRAISVAALAAMLAIAAASSTFAVTQIDPLARTSQREVRRPLQEVPPRKELPPPQDVPPRHEEPPPAPAPVGVAVRHISGIAWNDLPALMVTLIASWAIGSGARSRRAHLDELHAHAADLERQRDQQSALAVAAERSRLSRELHDVVAHGLSVMVIQAQGAAAALDNRPADTRRALEAIVKTGRDSLTDMRQVLATVDQTDDAWRPQPGLAALPALLTQVREAGTPVRLKIVGEPVPLSTTVDLSAYRIVQEALTNAMKHAGPAARAEVVVSYTDAHVEVEVTDDGPGDLRLKGASSGGNGLRGMRERIRLLGGSFEAGRRASAGFQVRAVLPLRGQQS